MAGGKDLDIEGRRYCSLIEPEPRRHTTATGIISRFCAKHSSVLEVERERQAEILSAAVKSPKGIVTVYLLNKGEEAREVRIAVAGVGAQNLSPHRVTEEAAAVPGFALNPLDEIVLQEGESALLHVPGESLTTLSGQ